MGNEFTFCRIYKELANQHAREEDLYKLYWDLQDRIELDKVFCKSCRKEHQLKSRLVASMPDLLGASLAIDAVAHAIHQGGDGILQQIYPGADYSIVKSTLDELAGKETTSEIRKFNRSYFTTLLSDEGIYLLEKQLPPSYISGKVTKEAIKPAIKEYEKLYKVGLASPAEILTLSRYYPDSLVYRKAVEGLHLENEDNEPTVVGGPASVEMVDREGHLITADALRKAFDRFMKNFRERNLNVLHCLAPGTKVYVIGKRLYMPIEKIEIGDKVLTHAGVYRPVTKILSHSDHEGYLIELTLKNKEQILITPEHKVLTTLGWKEAQALTVKDTLLTADFPGTKKGSQVANSHKVGKTLEEFYGVEKALLMKRKISEKHIGKPSLLKGLPWLDIRGKTMAEIMGSEERSAIRSSTISAKIKAARAIKKWANNAYQRRGKTWLEAYGHPKPQYKDYHGAGNSNWKGGISRNGYPFTFGEDLRKSVRDRDGQTCQLCGITQEEENKQLHRNLSVNHIDYDKTNNDSANLITLCCRCNSKVNSNRDYWTSFFKNKVQEIIHNGTEITSVEKVLYGGPVYNLEVEEYHSYTGRGIIYHNSDVTVGWVLPAYISKGGEIYASGVDDKQLWVIGELRNDTKVAKRVADEVAQGNLKSYSIAGSATDTEQVQKGLQNVMVVKDMELAEITLCESGINQGAMFNMLKSADDKPQELETILNSFTDEPFSLPGFSVYVEKGNNPKVVVCADKSNSLTDMLILELSKRLPEGTTITVYEGGELSEQIPVYKTLLTPMWVTPQVEKEADHSFPGTLGDNISKDAAEGTPPRSGLVPQSGDLRHPKRWVLPREESQVQIKPREVSGLVKPVATEEGHKITEESKRVFIAYAKDAVNWAGHPLVGGNVGGSKEERGNLTQLKRAGLINTSSDGKDMFIDFTEAGRKYAEELGIDIETGYNIKKSEVKKMSNLENLISWLQKQDERDEAEEKRRKKHRQLLDEQGFPQEAESEEEFRDDVAEDTKYNPTDVNEAGTDDEITPEEKERLRPKRTPRIE